MTGLNKITDKILADAKADAESKLSAADKECERISAEYAEKAKKITEEADTAARQEAQEILSGARSADAMAQRNILLYTKGEMVDKAFDLAKKAILELPPEKYVELLVAMAVKAAKTKAEDERIRMENGDDAEEETVTECYVCLNASDREKYGASVIDSAKKCLGEGYSDTLSLSDSPVGIDGGLIFKYGSIEINCSLSTVIGQLHSTLEAKVSKTLFPEKRS